MAMFSTNQILEVSGNLSEKSSELENALRFAIVQSGHDFILREPEDDRDRKLLYQITEDGKYCIGWGIGKPKKGWLEYPFDFDIEIVGKIIRQHLVKFPMEVGSNDGIFENGFIMKCIKGGLSDEYEGIKSPFYGIVYFKPYTCFYAN